MVFMEMKDLRLWQGWFSRKSPHMSPDLLDKQGLTDGSQPLRQRSAGVLSPPTFPQLNYPVLAQGLD